MKSSAASGLLGAAVDRHRAGDDADLGDAPGEEEDIVRAAVDDLLERQEPDEHAPGEVAGGERDEREPLGAVPRADRVGGEDEGDQVGQPDPRTGDAQAELDLGEVDDLEAQVAHGPLYRPGASGLLAVYAKSRFSRVCVQTRWTSLPP